MAHKILTVIGARPQFIKAAAISRAVRSRPEMVEVLVHTGQHFDQEMSGVFFHELDIPKPAYNLEIHGCGHGEMTGRMLEGLEKVIIAEQPDVVLVYGDTNSTLAGALAAAKLLIPLAHIEAGLRSYNRVMPEEINRVLVDHASTLLFCPTQSAVNNLKVEAVTNGVHKVGDVMYDATLFAVERSKEASTMFGQLKNLPSAYAVTTIHRAENTDTRSQLKELLDWVKGKARDMPVVFPLHPRTRMAAERFGLNFEGLILCRPVGYIEMAKLMRGAVEIYTDSGGLQKEAYFHRKPCVTLRDQTEWVETIECGWNRLWKGPSYAKRKDIAEYGDGHAAEEILDIIESFLRLQ